MGVREDRLRAEYDAMKEFRSQVVKWKTVGYGSPPDHYHITYNLKSIIGFKHGEPQYHKGFTIEIRFPPEYPRRSPEVRPLNEPRPFHPNIWLPGNGGHFCLEGTQHWIPGIGVSLDSICQMIGEIIAFQHVNLNSPANNDKTLRDWVESNLHIINKVAVTNPVDPSSIRLPDLADSIRWGGEPSSKSDRINFG